jgi:hypothetical protein
MPYCVVMGSLTNYDHVDMDVNMELKQSAVFLIAQNASKY